MSFEVAELTTPLSPLLIDLLASAPAHMLLAGLVEPAPVYAFQPSTQSLRMQGGCVPSLANTHYLSRHLPPLLALVVDSRQAPSGAWPGKWPSLL